MEENTFNKNLTENMKSELDNAEFNVGDAFEMAQAEFPNNPRAQELIVKESLGNIKKEEQIELYKLLDAKNKNTKKNKKKPKDSEDNK